MTLAPAASPPTRPKPEDADDAALDLPPIDGVEGEEEEAPPGLLDDEAMPKDDGDPFDDATGEADALRYLGDGDGDGDVTAHEGPEGGRALLDAGEADGLDIGAHDLLGDEGESLTDDGGESELTDDDDGALGSELAASPLDGGEEGPSTDDESLSEEGLPALGDEDDDAMDEASSFFEGDLTVHPRTAAAGSVEKESPWASRWERFGPPLTSPAARALVCSLEGVLAAGREVVRVDLEGGVERLPARGLRGGEVTRLLRADGALYATTETGGLFASRDQGTTFAELTSWREIVRPEEAAAGLDVVASRDGALWGRTAQGGLLVSRDGGARWEKVDVDGFVRAVAVDDAGAPALLVRALGVTEVLRAAAPGAGAPWSRATVSGELLPQALDGHATLVAHERAVAIAIDGEGVLRSKDGLVWSRISGTEGATALAMLDGSGMLVVAMPAATSDGDAHGAQLTLSHVGADGELREAVVWEDRSEGAPDGGVAALAVDHAHQVVWAAGGFGLAGFQPRMLRLQPRDLP